MLVCKELGVKSSEAVYVGDAVVDVRSAKEAGCKSVIICRSQLLEVFLKEEKPDYMLVLPWFFKEEFLRREKRYLKNGGHFIFPLPEVKVF